MLILVIVKTMSQFVQIGVQVFDRDSMVRSRNRVFQEALGNRTGVVSALRIP